MWYNYECIKCGWKQLANFKQAMCPKCKIELKVIKNDKPKRLKIQKDIIMKTGGM